MNMYIITLVNPFLYRNEVTHKSPASWMIPQLLSEWSGSISQIPRFHSTVVSTPGPVCFGAKLHFFFNGTYGTYEVTTGPCCSEQWLKALGKSSRQTVPGPSFSRLLFSPPSHSLLIPSSIHSRSLVRSYPFTFLSSAWCCLSSNLSLSRSLKGALFFGFTIPT